MRGAGGFIPVEGQQASTAACDRLPKVWSITLGCSLASHAMMDDVGLQPIDGEISSYFGLARHAPWQFSAPATREVTGKTSGVTSEVPGNM